MANLGYRHSFKNYENNYGLSECWVCMRYKSFFRGVFHVVRWENIDITYPSQFFRVGKPNLGWSYFHPKPSITSLLDTFQWRLHLACQHWFKSESYFMAHSRDAEKFYLYVFRWNGENSDKMTVSNP